MYISAFICCQATGSFPYWVTWQELPQSQPSLLKSLFHPRPHAVIRHDSTRQRPWPTTRDLETTTWSAEIQDGFQGQPSWDGSRKVVNIKDWAGLKAKIKYYCPVTGPVTARIYWSCKFSTGPTVFFCSITRKIIEKKSLITFFNIYLIIIYFKNIWGHCLEYTCFYWPGARSLLLVQSPAGGEGSLLICSLLWQLYLLALSFYLP